MAWGRLDDRANTNGKLLALSDSAWRMWGCGLIYCQANLTDGHIPTHAIETFGVRAKNKRLVADELCRSLVPGKGPLWHCLPDGWQIHDYLDWNDSREDVLKERKASKERIAKWRSERNQNGSSNGVQDAHGGENRTGLTTSTTTSTPTTTSTTTSTTTPRKDRGDLDLSEQMGSSEDLNPLSKDQDHRRSAGIFEN